MCAERKKNKSPRELLLEELGEWLENNVNHPQLNTRHAEFLRSWLFDNKTYDEIALEAGISRERVRQLINKAIERIREIMRFEEQPAEVTNETVESPRIFYFDVTELALDAKKADRKKMEHTLNMPLHALNLSTRALNCLKAAEAFTVIAALEAGRINISWYRNIGKKTLDEIENFLNELNFRWDDDGYNGS